MAISSSLPIPLTDCSERLKSHPAYFNGNFAQKAGILPFFRTSNDDIFFLVAAPKPVRNPDDTVPYGMARGTRRILLEGQWVDAQTPTLQQQAILDKAPLEPAAKTALLEAEEELGLSASNIHTLHDIGTWQYKDYGIHIFLAKVKEQHALLTAQDSEKVNWFTTETIEQMANNGDFKTGYLPIIKASLQEIQKNNL